MKIESETEQRIKIQKALKIIAIGSHNCEKND